MSKTTKKPAEKGKLAALLAENRAGATSVEKGNFRLDWKRALDKVKRFQLTDPHRYVLEIVQGAIAGGATQVAITTDSDDVMIDFDGARPEGGELEHLFDFLFSQDQELAAQKQLALGINSALALEPKFVRVDVGDGETAHRLQLSSHDDLAITELSGDEVLDGTRVHVRDRLSWHVIADVFRAKSIEARLVKDHCRFSPVPITLDGGRVDTGLAVEALVEHEFTGTVRGKLALPVRLGTMPRIHVCMNGVEVAPLEKSEISWMEGLGVVGYIDDPRLTRNASHTDLHRDERFKKLIAALSRKVRGLLEELVEQRLIETDHSTNETDRYYLTQAARALLRAKRHTAAKKRKPTLTEVEKALLDLPGVVELAVNHPTELELRRIWNSFLDRGAVGVAQRRYDIDLDDLPDGTYPIMGPAWVSTDIFGNTVESLDELLAATEQGQKNRRLREARARPPELMPGEAFMQVPIEGSHGIRGELGLATGLTESIRVLVGDAGEIPNSDDPRDSTLVIYMRKNVPLGGRWVRTPLSYGIALLESDAFEPDRSWSDISPNKASQSAAHLLQAAVPRLILELAKSFSLLPPPKNLREAGAFSPEPNRHREVMQAIGARWPTDALAHAARGQIDHVLARRTCPRKEMPEVHAWPLFFTVGGIAVSLDQITGKTALDGRGVIKPDHWKAAVQVPWGEGEADDEAILNLTPLQKEILERQIGRTFPGADSALKSARAALVRAAETRLRREANIKRAESRTRAKTLDDADYEVILDVAVPGGNAQIGIPRLGNDSGWLRPLVDGLPLADQSYVGTFPVHAIVESTHIKADDAFEKPLLGPGYMKVVAALNDARPALIEAFSATPGAMTQNGVRLIWQYLHQHKVPRKKPLDSLPDALADFPLLPTISGDRMSLRQLRDEADTAQRKHFRYVEIIPGYQESDRPVFVCSDQRRKTVTRLTGVRGSDYSDDLEREMEARSRRNRPPRRPVLLEPTLLKVSLEHDDFDGEVGIPAGAMGDPGEGGWVDVLIDGVPLERRRLDFSSLPLIAVVSSNKLKANKAWKSVVRNATWKRAVKALRAAAEKLVLRGCKLAADRARDFRSPALLLAFQRMAAERFQGRPADPMHPSKELNKAVAAAPIWESVDHRDFVSLAEISEHWKRTRRVWLIPFGEGQLAPGRLIVRGAAATRAALAEIFADAVRDGAKVFEKDQAAARRMANAPPLQTLLTEGSCPVDVVRDDGPHGLAIRGQVATPIAYAHSPAGLHVTLGIDGKKFAELVLDHPLRGVARIDCSGLRTNNAWTKPSDGGQHNWIEEHVTAALWESVAATIASASETDGDDNQRLLMVECLGQIMSREGPESLRASLMAAPIFRTVQRKRLSADELFSRKEAGETVYVVSDELDEGNPLDGRLLIRVGETGRKALQKLLGDAAVGDDDRWRKELEGAARFQTLLQTEPHLEGRTIASVFFQQGSTHGVVGMLVPPNEPTYGKEIDLPSAVRLHIGGRRICTLEDRYHPGIEAWINDDRLSPTGAFDNVARDEVFEGVLAVLRAQLPELLARAAEHWMSDSDDGTRLRLCRHALTEREQLGALVIAEPQGPAARLRGARMWECLTGSGRTRLSTAQLLEAHAAGHLRTAHEDAPTETPEQGIVVVLGAPEELIISTTLGTVGDYTQTLHTLAARRAFHRRPRVTSVNVAEVARHEPMLGRRSLDEPSFVGELGLPATPGRTLQLHIFVDDRHFNTVELPAVCRGIAAVQSNRLKLSPRYDSIIQDEAFEALVQHAREALWDAVVQLSAALSSLDPSRARFARIVLADALSAARASNQSAPGFKRMQNTLEAAPLFIDVHGQLWSLRALDEATPPDQAIRCVSSETAAVAAVPGDLVLVLDDAMWAPMSRLLRLERDDSRYLEHAQGAQRRNAAATTFKMPANTIARAPIESPLVTGELALQVPTDHGEVAIFSRGRMVQSTPQPKLRGLIGYVDGAIETDRAFANARLTGAHLEELERLWSERLEAAATEAASFRGRRKSAKWLALSSYAQHYIMSRIDDLGAGMQRRRNCVMAPDETLAPALRTALTAPMIQLNDASWIDLATAVSGDDPLIIVAPKAVKRPPRNDARVVLGDDITLRLLSALLGSGRVMTVEQAREAVAKAKARAEKKRLKAEEAKAKRAATAHTRTMSALKSLLRDVGKQHFKLEVIKKMRLDGLGKRGDLAVLGDEHAIVVNRDHILWKKTVAASLADAPDAVRHLAVALVAFLAHADGAFFSDAGVRILSRLAR